VNRQCLESYMRWDGTCATCVLQHIDRQTDEYICVVGGTVEDDDTCVDESKRRFVLELQMNNASR
jgi:hypothetical protein